MRALHFITAIRPSIHLGGGRNMYHGSGLPRLILYATSDPLKTSPLTPAAYPAFRVKSDVG